MLHLPSSSEIKETTQVMIRKDIARLLGNLEPKLREEKRRQWTSLSKPQEVSTIFA